MNLSGILVQVPPQQTQHVITLLQDLPGVEVHHQNPATGHIVLVQEAESTEAEISGLERIQALPHVLSAAMVFHYFEDEAEVPNCPPPEPNDAETPTNKRVPPFLVL